MVLQKNFGIEILIYDDFKKSPGKSFVPATSSQADPRAGISSAIRFREGIKGLQRSY
jgi:hypothetical protein